MTERRFSGLVAATLGLAMLAAAPMALADAGATDEEDYLIVDVSDLVDLCNAKVQEPNFASAIHMCHGYIVGAHQLHEAAVKPSETGGFYCLPSPPPSRDAAVLAFVNWARATDGAMGLPAIEGLMRWANSEFPCG
ncbi:MAG: Rap1a/Tai family immunity protein [Pseudomonadota bacterium]